MDGRTMPLEELRFATNKADSQKSRALVRDNGQNVQSVENVKNDGNDEK